MFYLVIKNNSGWFKLVDQTNLNLQNGLTLDANFARAQMKNWNIHAIYIAQLILIVVQCCSKTLVIMNEIRDSMQFYALFLCKKKPKLQRLLLF